MSDFLGNLARRALDVDRPLQPRPRGRFEPAAADEAPAPRETASAPSVEPVAPIARQVPATAGPRLVDEAAPASLALSPGARVVRQQASPPMRAVTDERLHDGADAPPIPAAEVSKRIARPSPLNGPSSATPESLPRSEAGLRPTDRKQRPEAPAPSADTPTDSPLAPAPLHPRPRRERIAEPEAAPVVRVTIGRVDVRAVLPAAKEPARRAEGVKPKLPLDEYLRQRGDGRR